jgi:hypothetical protein
VSQIVRLNALRAHLANALAEARLIQGSLPDDAPGLRRVKALVAQLEAAQATATASADDGASNGPLPD